jgi:hypothetical protein
MAPESWANIAVLPWWLLVAAMQRSAYLLPRVPHRPSTFWHPPRCTHPQILQQKEA